MADGSAPESRKFNHFAEIAGFIWQIADLLRGDYKQSDYGKVILPFTVLRRLDCVLEPTKAKVDLPRFRGHPEPHESAIGVCHGKEDDEAEVFG